MIFKLEYSRVFRGLYTKGHIGLVMEWSEWVIWRTEAKVTRAVHQGNKCCCYWFVVESDAGLLSTVGPSI